MSSQEVAISLISAPDRSIKLHTSSGCPSSDATKKIILFLAMDNRLAEMVSMDVNPESVDARDYSGRTPLIYAAINSSPEMIEFLISRGANVNARDFNGDTPLMCACQNLKGMMPDDLSIIRSIRLLADKGADIGAKNRSMNSLMDLAAMSCCRSAVIALHEIGLTCADTRLSSSRDFVIRSITHK